MSESDEKSADAIVEELEKISEKAEKTEQTAKETAAGIPPDAPEWFKTFMRGSPNPRDRSEPSSEPRIYTSRYAREQHEGNMIREGHFRAEAERLQERGEKFASTARGSVFDESDKEERARDASNDMIANYRGWDDAAKHIVPSHRLSSLTKELLKLAIPGAIIVFVAVSIFDPSALAPAEAQAGPWFNNGYHEAWILAVLLAVLGIVFVLRRRREL